MAMYLAPVIDHLCQEIYVAYGSRHGDVGKNPFAEGCAVRSSGIPSASRASARLPFGETSETIGERTRVLEEPLQRRVDDGEQALGAAGAIVPQIGPRSRAEVLQPQVRPTLGDRVAAVEEVFLPKLDARGVDRSTIDKLTRDNPFRAFSG